MAVLQVDFFSNAVKRIVPMTVLLPIEIPEAFLSVTQPLKLPLKTMYLLHGHSGSHRDWLSGTRIEALSRQYQVAIVMPSGENSFYLDDAVRDVYYERLIAEEIVSFTRTAFPLSHAREDTTIAGLSMGGFGAMHSGLKYAHVFGHIIALSSALITDMVSQLKEGEGNAIAPYSYYRHVFGDPTMLLGSDKDPKFLAEQIVLRGNNIPEIYMACGTEDFLIEENRDFHQHLTQLGVKHFYQEGSGTHDWSYWDAHIEQAMAWLYQA